MAGGALVKTVIYLDVLLLVNFLVGYFLLKAVGLLTGTMLPFWRVMLGAAAAACSSLILLAPELPFWGQLLYQLGTALAICRLAFGKRPIRTFMRQILWFTLLNLLEAGFVVFAVQHWLLVGIETNNLAVYVNLSPWVLLLSVLAVYLCIRLGVLLFGEPPPPEDWQIELCVEDNKILLRGYLDTGFMVQDPVSGGQVILLNWEAVQKKLPPALQNFLEAYFLGQSPQPYPGMALRLIPCRTVAGQQVLPGIIVEKARIQRNGKCMVCNRLTAAFTTEALLGGDYDVLFGRGFLADCTIEKKEGCTECGTN